MSAPSATEDRSGGLAGPRGLLFELWLIKQAVYPLIEKVIHETGLSGDQYGLLLLIERLQPVAPRDIARHCGMRANTVSAALQRLERPGLLERRSNEHDARSVLISLSAAGQATTTRAIELAESALDRITPLVDGVAVAVAVSELNRAFRTLAVLPVEAPRRQPDLQSAPAAHVMFDLWLMKQASYPLLEQALGPRTASADDVGLTLLIGRMEPVTPGDIVRSTGMRPNNLSAALGRLAGRGQIERTPNEHDARSVLVSLSDEGSAAARVAVEHYEQITARLGTAEFVDEASSRLRELNSAIRVAAGLPALDPTGPALETDTFAS